MRRNSRNVGKQKRKIALRYVCSECLAGEGTTCWSLGHRKKGQHIEAIHIGRLLDAGFNLPGFYTRPQPGPGLHPSARDLHEELERAKAKLKEKVTSG